MDFSGVVFIYMDVYDIWFFRYVFYERFKLVGFSSLFVYGGIDKNSVGFVFGCN